MTQRLADRLTAFLAELAHSDGRQVLGVYADPLKLMQLEIDADASPRLAGLVGDETFAGYPLRSSPRPGVWAVLAPKDDLPTEARLVE